MPNVMGRANHQKNLRLESAVCSEAKYGRKSQSDANIHMRILQRWELLKVHSKVTRQESQGQEKDGDKGQLLHALILICPHGVENETDHIVALRAHLVKRGNNHDTVIFDIAQVCVRSWRDVDRRLGL